MSKEMDDKRTKREWQKKNGVVVSKYLVYI